MGGTPLEEPEPWLGLIAVVVAVLFVCFFFTAER